ncbi:uncharacterized protein TNCV_3392691 [Trichonephila clavipes]|nr:uncharacterized protein TNCV_3392691 [Trichonephila clavipes]
MAPGSRCMSDNTCLQDVMDIPLGYHVVKRINNRGDRVLKAMAPHVITPAVGAVCRCKAKAGLRRSPRGLHTRTRFVITAEIESGFVAKDHLVPFHCSPVHSKRRH